MTKDQLAKVNKLFGDLEKYERALNKAEMLMTIDSDLYLKNFNDSALIPDDLRARITNYTMACLNERIHEINAEIDKINIVKTEDF